jgi:LmbE family N-acetylglucosaminyl deacetylase
MVIITHGVHSFLFVVNNGMYSMFLSLVTSQMTFLKVYGSEFAEGVDVHVAIATDGVAGSVAEGYEDTLQDLVNVRTRELDAAVAILGVTLHKLGYRDSGYINDPANHHPEAFINVDEHEAIGKIVRLIREIRPQVVITHDETGGYFHPDHIQCWKVTLAAFHAAADPQQYPEVGLEPYQPERLYYTAFPNAAIKVFHADHAPARPGPHPRRSQ